MTDYEIRETVKNRLIALRIENDLTQTDVGKIVGKSKTTVATWEQGKSSPDIQTLYKLAQFYGKSLDYMFGERDD